MLEATAELGTLIEFRFKKHFAAEAGKGGRPMSVAGACAALSLKSGRQQSTMGSVSRVPVWYEAIEPVMRSAAGMPVWAALLQGESLYGQTRIRRGFIVIGNESKGISPALQELAMHRITIPRIGEAESLNAAVAAGIVLSHLVG